MFKKIIKKEKGFTLVETLIAISILMISVAAPLSLAAKGIQAANLAKEQIVAYYLAQDAFEMVKNIVDSNKLGSYSYSQGEMIHGDLNDICIFNECKIDTLTGKIEIYSLGEKIKFSKTNNIYGFDSASASDYTDTIYERYFKIEKVQDDGSSIDEIRVLITIKWDVPFVGEQTYTLKSNITNW